MRDIAKQLNDAIDEGADQLLDEAIKVNSDDDLLEFFLRSMNDYEILLENFGRLKGDRLNELLSLLEEVVNASPLYKSNFSEMNELMIHIIVSYISYNETSNILADLLIKLLDKDSKSTSFQKSVCHSNNISRSIKKLSNSLIVLKK